MEQKEEKLATKTVTFEESREMMVETLKQSGRPSHSRIISFDDRALNKVLNSLSAWERQVHKPKGPLIKAVA